MSQLSRRDILTGTLGLLNALSARSWAAEHVIRLTTLAPKDSSFHKSLLKMGQAWRSASGGAVELIIYPGGIQGGEAAMVDRMRINQTQAGLLTVTGLAEIEPGVAGLQSMPMMFRSLDEVDYVTRKLQAKLEKRLLDKGFVVLFWGDTGWVYFFSKEPVIRPDDLRRLKLFTWAGNTKQVDLMKAAGFKPVALETADILASLQTGLIDAVPMPPAIALAGQVYTVARHMLELKWAPLVGALVMTRRAWDRVPADFHSRFRDAAIQAGDEIKTAGRKEATESVRVMKERWGLTVHTVTPAIEAEWRQLAESVYPQIRGSLVPADIFDEVQRLVQESRAN